MADTATRTEPYPIRVTRWVCAGIGCTRSYSKRATTEAHMETCWRVPENRACLTCAHFDPGICCSGFECGCRGERNETCRAGVPIEDHLLRSDCPMWEAQP